MQAYDSVMSEYFCSKLIDSTFDIKRLTAFVNLFSSKDYIKNKFLYEIVQNNGNLKSIC